MFMTRRYLKNTFALVTRVPGEQQVSGGHDGAMYRSKDAVEILHGGFRPLQVAIFTVDAVGSVKLNVRVVFKGGGPGLMIWKSANAIAGVGCGVAKMLAC